MTDAFQTTKPASKTILASPPSALFSPQKRWLTGPMLGLAAVLILFALLLYWKGQLGTFLSLRNIQVLLHTSSVSAVVALGMLVIIISGGIDLSVGSVAALVTVVTMQTFRLLEAHHGSALASLAAVSAGVSVGGLAGLVNGLAVTRLRVTPFVATLGMLSIARGLAVWLAGRKTISFPGARPSWVDALSRATVNRYLFDPGVWGMFALAVLMAVVLRRTVFGRYCYAIGSNEATARLCGIAVERTKVWIYVLAGLLTGWAGILVFAQGSGGDPTSSVGLELDVIAAVVIGGASLSGGQGSVSGTLMGVLILAILENGVNLFGVAVEVKYILIGAIVIINTALSQWQRRRSE
ncbi:MAG TPA: ABC transporter permease [Gemmataceae bacterium]|nr:ABC transporter permease [Gemmataceae bacterium]